MGLLIILFLILFVENHFKPRLYFTANRDLVLWYWWNNKRNFYIICNI